MPSGPSHHGLDEVWRLLDGDARSSRVFYPRRARTAPPPHARDYDIPVAPGVTVGARWHRFEASNATMLAFHGNGETVCDYDDVAMGWRGVGINLFMVDYRGYGWSGGKPSLRALYDDAGAVATFFLNELAAENAPAAEKPLLFGRSLGSSPATRIAVERGADFRGLILESAFGDVAPLLGLFGFGAAEVSSEVRRLLSNAELLLRVRIPVLLLHGSDDDLLPPSHARANFSAIPHDEKALCLIDGAGHNDILGFTDEYFGAIADFLGRTR
jgi:pimeloyl-ACP methyl ester carboxylesterase